MPVINFILRHISKSYFFLRAEFKVLKKMFTGQKSLIEKSKAENL